MHPKRLDRRAGATGMRVSILTVIAALVLSACGSGSETAAGTEAETGGDSGSSADVAVQPSGGSSAYCRAVLEVVEEAAASVDEDDPTQIGDLYTFMLDIFDRLASDAPSELKSDFALVAASLERYAEWSKDPLQPDPLDDAEQAAFEAANTRINAYTEDECGIDMDAGDEAVVPLDTGESGGGGGDASTATQTIAIGGETFEEKLSGAFEVSCDLYGDLETGSIGIYLDGTDFQSSVSSYDTGVEPGTYEGSIWVFASDPALDELTWDLQEIDGTFVLSKAESVSDEEWFFEGTFSAAVEDPPSSIEATFSCVGPTGY